MTSVRMRVLGLVVVAALTAIAFTASGASALPEWGSCVVQAQHEGKYKDSNCTSKAKKVNEKFTGEFEFAHIPGQEFSNFFLEAGHGTPVEYQSKFHECVPSDENLSKCREGETEEVLPVTVECTEHQFSGKISPTNPKEVVKSGYVGENCTGLGSLPCGNSVGGAGEDILANILKGSLGYINKATKEVGLELKPEAGKRFLKADCGGVLGITVGEAMEKEGPAYPPKGGGDGVIGVVTPVNQKVQVWEMALTANGETAQNIPSQFEGKGLAVLEDYSTNLAVTGKGSKWSPASLVGHSAVEGDDGEYSKECTPICYFEVKA